MTGTTAEQTDTSFTLHRAYNAPRERVFRALTTPEALTQWWGPEGCKTTDAQIDLQEGGRYRLTMKMPDGTILFLVGKYKEIRAPQRLVYTWYWENDPDAGESLVTLELEEEGSRTQLTIKQEFFPNREVCDQHVWGWTSQLGRLEAYLG